MKSSFSRSFFPAIAILLMALLTVGFSFQMLARNVMEKRTMERLKTGTYQQQCSQQNNGCGE